MERRRGCGGRCGPGFDSGPPQRRPLGIGSDERQNLVGDLYWPGSPPPGPSRRPVAIPPEQYQGYVRDLSPWGAQDMRRPLAVGPSEYQNLAGDLTPLGYGSAGGSSPSYSSFQPPSASTPTRSAGRARPKRLNFSLRLPANKSSLNIRLDMSGLAQMLDDGNWGGAAGPGPSQPQQGGRRPLAIDPDAYQDLVGDLSSFGRPATAPPGSGRRVLGLCPGQRQDLVGDLEPFGPPPQPPPEMAPPHPLEREFQMGTQGG